MIPRGSPDIGWDALIAGVRDCLAPPSEEAAQASAEAAGGSNSLVCLSVRSGLDLVLQALALPAGSEVLVSAVTIRDVVSILEHHRLVAVPVDLDMERLAVDLDALERAVTGRTRAVLVAHLFGSQMELSRIAALAHGRGLLLLEDCAQAYDGRYGGHTESDVAMFSFGPIKTSTALGGAVLRFRNPALLARVRTLQEAYPTQPIAPYLRRMFIFMGLKALAHPPALGALSTLCRLHGRSHDQLITGLLRGFPGSNLIVRLRRRPCAPLLAMLARRLQQPPGEVVARRVALARAVVETLPEQRFVGSEAERHTYWVLPIVSVDPDALARELWFAGFDASRSASSLIVVEPPPGREPADRAAAVMGQLLYLPLHPALDGAVLERMACCIKAFESGQHRGAEPCAGA